jgi:DNA adenine methylase
LAKYDKPKNKIERARQFLIVSMMSINGMQGTDQGGFSYSDSYTRNNMEARVSRWYNLPARLVAVAERLRKVRIEKKNALTLLSFYMDRPATLVYLDPPYNTERSNGYNFDQKTEKFHRNLLSKIKKAKCMILLSGYDNELYNNELTKKRGWTKKTFSTYTKVTNGKLLKRREVLWMNRFCSIALKSKKIPIRLTKSEKHEKKVNPLRTATKR